jgi:septum formation protein
MNRPTRPPWQYAPLLLASQSPRRRELLDLAGFQYRVQSTDIEETFPDSLTPEEVPVFLAAAKNRAAQTLLREGEIALTADSVVILDGQLFGKPKDREDALDILGILQGRTHTVITGICLSHEGRIWSAAEHTRVSIEPASREELAWYVDAHQPFDKAGAYGVQEWIGLCRISRLEGSYANVVGLPVHLVYEAFRDRKI